jgi:hypothetical protein
MGQSSCKAPAPVRSQDATCGCGYGYYADEGKGDWVPGWMVRRGLAPARPDKVIAVFDVQDCC